MLTNKEKNFISAVVYLHNNESLIGNFLQSIDKQLDENFDKYEIICVNDHSTDNSIQEIKKIANCIKGALSIINLSFYQGLELAMNAGMDLSIGDFVYEFDSIVMDYPIETIMKIYRRSLEGFDIVSVGPQSIERRSSKLFYSVYNKFSNTNYKIRTESFRILSRRAINRVHAMSRTIPYRKAFYANCGLKTDMIIYDNQSIDKGKQTQLLKESRKDTAINSIDSTVPVTSRSA
jgi:dolichol-phosphate mannosyltransferase